MPWRLFVNFQQDDWSDWLAIAEFSYNNRLHTATKSSPFMLNYGREPRMPTSIPRQSIVESAQRFTSRMHDIHVNTAKALQQAADDMKRFADRHRTEQPSYKVGDLVWLDASNLATPKPAKKLDDKRYGPFPIIKVVSPTAMRLQLPVQWRIHPVFHVSKLRPAVIDRTLHPDPHTRPPPDLIDGEEHFEVESILDSRFRGRGLQYLVHWKGYPHEDNQWLPRSQLLISCPDIISLFHSSHPSAPRPLDSISFASLHFRPISNITTPPPDIDLSWPDGTYLGSSSLVVEDSP